MCRTWENAAENCEDLWGCEVTMLDQIVVVDGVVRWLLLIIRQTTCLSWAKFVVVEPTELRYANLLAATNVVHPWVRQTSHTHKGLKLSNHHQSNHYARIVCKHPTFGKHLLHLKLNTYPAPPAARRGMTTGNVGKETPRCSNVYGEQ